MINNYDDIVNLPHHVSKKRPQMSLYDRAAQFSPFAALTGHDDAIKETARLTKKQVMLDENIKEILDKKIQIINSRLKESAVEIKVTYFIKDIYKDGGRYATSVEKIKKVDYTGMVLITENKKIIPVNTITDIVIL